MAIGDQIDDPPEQPPPEPRTIEEAHFILDQIRFEHGILNEEDEAEIRKTSAEYQRKAKAAAQKQNRRFGATLKAISTQLYSSRFRFIYELIQNADDTAYSSIQSHDVPYIKFTVRSGEVIIDSNEDGFTVADVFAICDIAQSSKQKNQDTTGEKGLGFKSVFAISRLARIQSGLWSFEFRYPPDDDGVGMIAPYWVDSKPLDNNVRTRITLTMARTDDDFCQELKAAFQDVPATTLLFLRKLKKLIISFQREDVAEPSRTFMRENEWNESTRSISVETIGVKGRFSYRMWSNTFLVLPKSSSDNPQATANHSSMVQLAFPVDASTNQPRMSLDGQHAFNFLPMKRMAQLPFIIQADFDMAASREAVIDTPRNRALRNAACKLFADAITHFCADGRDLRYSWTQYLPGDQLDDFWKPLRSLIKDNLSEKSLLESRTSFPWPVSSLRIVPSVFQHQGEALFDKEIYLSNEYDEDAVAALKWLGLLALSKREMLECVKTDLSPLVGLFGSNRTAKSVIKSTELSDSWHTTFLEFLLHSICPDQQLKNELRKLAVLPLSGVPGTTWATPETALPTAVASRIYLPRIDTDDGSPIIDPEIGLRVLDRDACVEPARREFYAHWGISHVDPKLLVEKVTAKNTSRNSARLSHYVGHFSILFWHEATPLTDLHPLCAADTHCTRLDPKRLYLQSDKEYSTGKLLQGTIDHPHFGFLNNAYFDFDMVKGSVTRHINGKGQTWERWLMDVAGVRIYPELNSPEYDGVSPVFQEIVRRAPSMVVGTLRAHWNDYKAWVTGTPKILEDLKNAHVQCRTGKTHKLSQTILPTEATLTASRSFGVEEKMHFLCIDTEPDSANEADWAFLQLFDVCMKPSLSFSLEALDHLTRLPISEEQTKAHVIAVYESIGSVATFEDRDQLQDFFSDRSAICSSKQWRALDECVWEGPTDFLIPKRVLAREYTNRPRVQNLFTSLLGIGDATYKDMLEAIEATKLSISSTGILAKMYKKLDACVDWSAIGTEIRTTFEAKKLIFDGREWVSLSSCVWSSAVSLQGRPVLKRLYPTLLGFFVERLEVKSMNTTMMLEELIRLAGGDAPEPETMKMMLGEIASMLASEPMSDRVEVLLKKLKQIKFLPVTGTTASESTSLVSPKDSFLIVDDRRLGDAFRGKIRLLDFASNDLALMQSLFAAFRLGNSYLSRHVRSETTVQGSAMDEKLTRDMRRRSFAISCCVLSHKGSQAQTEYGTTHEQLLACEIFACAEMYTNLHVTQDGNIVTVPSDMSLLKITEDDGKLKIFVPKDDTQRRRCYRAHLSKQLMGFLDVTTESANKQLYRILNDHPSTLSEVLAEEGILEAEWLERPDYPDDDSDQASDDLVMVESASAQSRQSSTSGETTGLELELLPREGNLTLRFGEAGRIHVHPRSLMYGDGDSNSESDLSDQYSPERYRKVLEHVVRRAQGMERRRTNGGTAYDMGALYEALIPVTSGDLGMVPGQRIHPGVFRRIGAAGELFVFERLLARGLTAFSQANWQSRIRHLVRAHPDYQNMQPFAQAEVADIMYDDHEGQLERLVRHESGRRVPAWDQQGGPVQFMLEVKTTIRGCGEPFIISQHQYQLMSDHKLVEGQRPRVVYIVARVHHLLTADIGVEFFVDPKSLEGSTLQFDWGTCVVTPQA